MHIRFTVITPESDFPGKTFPRTIIITLPNEIFLLVPAHPGCPGQFPQSCKTVVCVCVCCNEIFVTGCNILNHPFVMPQSINVFYSQTGALAVMFLSHLIRRSTARHITVRRCHCCCFHMHRAVRKSRIHDRRDYRDFRRVP